MAVTFYACMTYEQAWRMRGDGKSLFFFDEREMVDDSFCLLVNERKNEELLFTRASICLVQSAALLSHDEAGKGSAYFDVVARSPRW